MKKRSCEYMTIYSIPSCAYYFYNLNIIKQQLMPIISNSCNVYLSDMEECGLNPESR